MKAARTVPGKSPRTQIPFDPGAGFASLVPNTTPDDAQKPDAPAERMRSCNKRRGITHAERAVLVALAYYDGERGCWPSVSTIGHDAGGMAARTVQVRLRALEKKKAITIEPRRGKSNRYTIHYQDTRTAGDEPPAAVIADSCSIALNTYCEKCQMIRLNGCHDGR